MGIYAQGREMQGRLGNGSGNGHKEPDRQREWQLEWPARPEWQRTSHDTRPGKGTGIWLTWAGAGC